MKKSKTSSTITNVLAAVDANYSYSAIEYDYDRERHCDASGCDSICRCATIVDFRIKSVDIDTVAARFIEGIDNQILAYCIARLPGIHKLYRTEAWREHTRRGYYGDELYNIKIESPGEIKKDITALYDLFDKERIEYILTKEYGYIAETIKSVKNYVVREVSVDSLVSPAQDYSQKLDGEHIARVEKTIGASKVPIGIYRPAGVNRWSVVDGRHRCVAVKNAKLKTVNIIVGEE
jgi:hypothetical protein